MSAAGASSTPLYHRVFLLLRDRLINGEFPPGQPLPGEVQLAQQCGVSRATLRKALAMLEADGLLTRRQGAGTYPRLLGRFAHQQARNLALVEQGEGGYRSVYSGEVRTHCSTIATGKTLGRLFPGAKQLSRIERLRLRDGVPHSLVVSYLRTQVCESLMLDEFSAEPLYELLVAAGYRIATVNQSISAETANDSLAEKLSVPLGSALLLVSGEFLSGDGDCLMRKDGYFPPQNYRYETTIVIDPD